MPAAMNDNAETVADVLAAPQPTAWYSPLLDSAMTESARMRREREGTLEGTTFTVPLYATPQPAAEPAYDRKLIATMLENLLAQRCSYLPGEVAEQVRLLRAEEGGVRTVSMPAKAGGSMPDVPEADGEVYELPTGERRVQLAKHARDLPVGTRLYATPSASTPQPDSNLRKQIETALNACGIDTRANLPDWQMADAMIAYLEGRPTPVLPQPEPKPAAVEVTDAALFDDALAAALDKYPHAHDGLTFFACAIRGPRQPTPEDLKWAKSEVSALQEGKSHG